MRGFGPDGGSVVGLTGIYYHIVLSVLCSLVVICCESFPVCDVFLSFVTFPYSIVGQAWYLIVLIPDLCLLPYFEIVNFPF